MIAGDVDRNSRRSQVALDGLENILKVGEIDKEQGRSGGLNQYAVFIEEAGGMVSCFHLV